MGKDSRTALFRTLQAVFEDHLFRHFRWGGDDLMILPAEDAMPKKGERLRRNQKREVVVVRLRGRYEIEAQSPEECPPLGRITLREVDHTGSRPHKADLVDGPLDVSVFAQIGTKFDELLKPARV